MARIWQESRQRPSSGDSGKSWNTVMPKAIQDLLPKDDAQRTFKAQAAATLAELGQMRCLLLEQVDTSISARVLIVLISWLAIIFGSVGLFAPPNSTVLISLLLVAVSVSVSILLILELDQPFGGLISISSQPIRGVLNHFQ
jgi:hypothetical protein